MFLETFFTTALLGAIFLIFPFIPDKRTSSYHVNHSAYFSKSSPANIFSLRGLLVTPQQDEQYRLQNFTGLEGKGRERFTQKKHSFNYSVSCFVYRIRRKKFFNATKSTSSCRRLYRSPSYPGSGERVLCFPVTNVHLRKSEKGTMFRGRYILTYKDKDSLHLLKVFDSAWPDVNQGFQYSAINYAYIYCVGSTSQSPSLVLLAVCFWP